MGGVSFSNGNRTDDFCDAYFLYPSGVVQIRKNTTISIIVHFVFGAFGFLVHAFGAVE
jgi:hypothetical protein